VPPLNARRAPAHDGETDAPLMNLWEIAVPAVLNEQMDTCWKCSLDRHGKQKVDDHQTWYQNGSITKLGTKTVAAIRQRAGIRDVLGTADNRWPPVLWLSIKLIWKIDQFFGFIDRFYRFIHQFSDLFCPLNDLSFAFLIYRSFLIYWSILSIF
jgi:hypothetical protein